MTTTATLKTLLLSLLLMLCSAGARSETGPTPLATHGPMP